MSYLYGFCEVKKIKIIPRKQILTSSFRPANGGPLSRDPALSWRLFNKVGAKNVHIIYLHSSSSSSVLSPSQTSDCKVILRSSESVVMIF